MPPDPKPADARPQRIAVAPRPNEPAVQYQLSINIVVAPPAFDEQRVRKIVDQEFDKLAKHVDNKKQ